jgi:ATP citrate (pro-S)-lyase
MLDNIEVSRVYSPGSVAYDSKSGGVSNELNDIIRRNSGSVCEGMAIGGERYPGSRSLGHFLRHQDHSSAKMLLLLGKVYGINEYDLIEAVQSGRITEPIIA